MSNKVMSTFCCLVGILAHIRGLYCGEEWMLVYSGIFLMGSIIVGRLDK